MSRLVLGQALVFGTAWAGFLGDGARAADEKDGLSSRSSAARGEPSGRRNTRDAGAERKGVAPPPPITVLAVFEWSREEVIGARKTKTELFIYSSGMTVLVLSREAPARAGAGDDDGKGSVPSERVFRRRLPREIVVGLLKTLETERFRGLPERFVFNGRRAEGRVVTRATLRIADRTIAVTCEPPGNDRSLREAPRGWAAIEKRVRAIIASLTPKANEADDSSR
ncbi:MAG: hypothetical protein HYY84_07220 [Deltaproteobacteria bacterium]|nr:hypothetical protein [Deltaproteobacteria bacterium]